MLAFDELRLVAAAPNLQMLELSFPQPMRCAGWPHIHTVAAFVRHNI